MSQGLKSKTTDAMQQPTKTLSYLSLFLELFSQPFFAYFEVFSGLSLTAHWIQPQHLHH